MARAKSKKRQYTSARDRAEKNKMGFESTSIRLPEGASYFKPKAGVMLIDIIPFVAGKGNPWAEEGMLHWERTYYAHRGIGANSDTYVCPRMSKTDKCPVCDYRTSLLKKGGEANEKLAQDLSPKQRQLFNVIDRKNPDKGIQIWDISYHLFGKLLDARIRNADEEDMWDQFFFIEDGLTLRVGFAEKSFGGITYVEAETIDFKPRRTPYDDEVIEQAYCLDDLLIIPTYDELKKVLLQMEDEAPGAKKTKAAKKAASEDEDFDDEEEEEEEPAPEPKKKKAPVEEEEDEDEPAPEPKKKKAPVEEEEEDEDLDDEDWDDFDDEEDEEEDEPAPESKKKKAPVEEEEEDFDEEEEEDEPAPEPKKTKAAKKAASEDEDFDDEDWDDFDDEEEEDEPKKKTKKVTAKKTAEEPAPKKKKKAPVEEEDEDLDDEDWDDFDDEDED